MLERNVFKTNKTQNKTKQSPKKKDIPDSQAALCFRQK